MTILPFHNGGPVRFRFTRMQWREPDRVKALSGPEILQQMEQSSKLAHSASPYTEVRRYSLRNERFKRESEMDVRATHGERGTTSFEVLNVIGSEDIYRRVFTKLLEGETQLSTRPTTETALTGCELRSRSARD